MRSHGCCPGNGNVISPRRRRVKYMRAAKPASGRVARAFFARRDHGGSHYHPCHRNHYSREQGDATFGLDGGVEVETGVSVLDLAIAVQEHMVDTYPFSAVSLFVKRWISDHMKQKVGLHINLRTVHKIASCFVPGEGKCAQSHLSNIANGLVAMKHTPRCVHRSLTAPSPHTRQPSRITHMFTKSTTTPDACLGACHPPETPRATTPAREREGPAPRPRDYAPRVDEGRATTRANAINGGLAVVRGEARRVA